MMMMMMILVIILYECYCRQWVWAVDTRKFPSLTPVLGYHAKLGSFTSSSLRMHSKFVAGYYIGVRSLDIFIARQQSSITSRYCFTICICSSVGPSGQRWRCV